MEASSGRSVSASIKFAFSIACPTAPRSMRLCVWRMTSAASRGAAFVNAVLRNVLRHPGEPALPSRDTDPLGYLRDGLSILNGSPDAMWKSWASKTRRHDVADRTSRLQSTCASRAESTFDRAQAQLGVESERVAILPHGLRAYSGKLQGSKLFQGRSRIVQDAGAQLIPHLLEPSEDDVVLDVCAAPGGKATALAEIAHRGSVIALDRETAPPS